MRFPVRTVRIDPGDRIPQRRPGAVLLEQPRRAQPAAAVAPRAGDIEVRGLGPEIRQRVLGLHLRPGLRALTMRLARVLFAPPWRKTPCVSSSASLRASGAGSTTTGAPGLVLLAPDQRLGLVDRLPAEKPDVAADQRVWVVMISQIPVDNSEGLCPM
jgi:hypothetical protein